MRFRDVFNAPLNLLSILKQKMYCNIHNIIYMVNNPKMIILNTPKIKVDIVRVYRVDDLYKYYHIPKIRSVFTKFKYFLRQGVIIYLAVHKGNVAGHYLITKLEKFKPYLYNAHSIFSMFGNKDAYYIFYCNTFEEYRGNGIYPYMLGKISGDIFRKNRNAVIYISTEATNIASQKGIKKAGFERIGELKYIQIGLIRKEKVHKDDSSK